MIPKAFNNFILDLIEKTNNQVLNWTKSDEDAFSLNSKDASVTISYYLDIDRELSYYTFNFINLSTKNQSGFKISSDEDDFNTMGKLFTLASASANNIKDELDNFFK
ncbi:MAG: hypothetical protein Q8L81_09050 [Bacteroidota bacterium]|nr:hypothetical protein [Bacteroidota bacterium]